MGSDTKIGSDLTVPASWGLGTEQPLPDRERDAALAALKAAALPVNTRRAYEGDLRLFLEWCAQNRVRALPASEASIAAWLTERATRPQARRRGKPAPDAPATLERRLAAVSFLHRAKGHPSPWKTKGLQQLLRGVRRTRGSKQREARPLLSGEITTALSAAKWTARDRAILLVGFAGCLRESEIVNLDVEHVSFGADGSMVLRIEGGKTDKDARGEEVVVTAGSGETCPVAAMRVVLAARSTGPVFVGSTGRRLKRQAVDRAVKRAAGLADLPVREYSGHSLRAGFATQAALSGVPEWRIQKQGRWRTVEMVRKYTRPVELGRDGVTNKLWGTNGNDARRSSQARSSCRVTRRAVARYLR